MADQFEQVFRVSDGEAVEGMSDHYIGNIPLTFPSLRSRYYSAVQSVEKCCVEDLN